jgi:hypothetical protein
MSIGEAFGVLGIVTVVFSLYVRVRLTFFFFIGIVVLSWLYIICSIHNG